MLVLPRPMLIGVVHLPTLPGAPGHSLSIDEIQSRALTDARTLAEAGFAAALIENFGDMPFSPGRVEAETIAAMAVIADAIKREVDLPVGINVLRNDARSALGIAAVCGASFIRVNVHVGTAATDQGVIEGRAFDTIRERDRLGCKAAILADVHVKHAVTLHQPEIGQAAKDLAYRGMADGLIVSGSATGLPTAMDDLRRVRRAVRDRPLLVGSGTTVENVGELLTVADGAIVGTSIKEGGVTTAPIDPERAHRLVEQVRA